MMPSAGQQAASDFSDPLDQSDLLQDNFAFEELELAQTITNVGVSLIDRNFRFIRVNGVMAQIHGLAVELHPGLHVREVLPAIAQQIEADLELVLRNGTPKTDVIVHGTTKASADQRSWAAQYFPHRNSAGELTGVFCVVRDITDALANTQEERETRRRFAKALEGSEVGIWELDFETGTFWRSQVQQQNLGSEPISSERSAMDWTNAIHPEDLIAQAEALRSHVAGHTPFYEGEIRLQVASGGWGWFLVRGTVTDYFSDGTVKRITGTALDIGERKQRALDQLLIAELSSELVDLSESASISHVVNRLGQHLGSTKLVYCGIDHHRREAVIRSEWASWPLKRTVNLRVEEANWIQFASCSLADNLRLGLGSNPQFDIVLRDLNWHAAEIFILKSRGAVFGALLVASDHAPAPACRIASLARLVAAQLSDAILRARSEEGRLRAEEEVRRLLRFGAMSALASTLAHELNQPLAATANLLGVAQEEIVSGRCDASNLTKQVIHQAASQILRAGKLIRRMREFAMTGEPKLEMGSLREAVEIARQSLQMLVNERGIDFVVNGSADLPNVPFDRIQVVQVIGNLLRNCIDALENHQSPMITLALDFSEECVNLSVHDNGRGFSSEEMAGLFKPFKSVKKDGMGLGLTVCKMIVDAHHGTLTASNNESGGACFSMSLPVEFNNRLSEFDADDVMLRTIRQLS